MCSREQLNIYTLSDKKVLSRTLKSSSAQRSAVTFKGSRWNPLDMVLALTFPEKPLKLLEKNL